MIEAGDNHSLNIKNVKVEYLGEKIFRNIDILENRLIFKKRNSQYLHFDLFIPAEVCIDIYKQMDNKKIKKVEDFLSFYIIIVSNSIIFTYNRINLRDCLSYYRNDSFGIVDNIYKKNIYKVVFEVYGKLEIIYFDIKEYRFFG